MPLELEKHQMSKANVAECPRDYSLANIRDYVGSLLGVSPWHQVTQEDINAFGAATHDPDPNHIDPDYARTHGSYRFPIAFGFQTVALLTRLATDAGIRPRDVAEEFNYGFDRLRLVAPVPVDSRIRGRFVLEGVKEREDGGFLVTYGVTVEIEGSERPALVAQWLALMFSEAGAKS
jgi:acyl dehydratase